MFRSSSGRQAGRDERGKPAETVVENTGRPAMTGTDTYLSGGEHRYHGFSRYGANTGRESRGNLPMFRAGAWTP